MPDLMPPMSGAEWRLLPAEIQAVTPILTCSNCRATIREPDGNPWDVAPSEHCGDCPPWKCEDCGEMSTATDLCSCWVSLEGMPLADIKALFAEDGTFSVGGLGAHRREDGSDV
jgi:hypothetical protein